MVFYKHFSMSWSKRLDLEIHRLWLILIFKYYSSFLLDSFWNFGHFQKNVLFCRQVYFCVLEIILKMFWRLKLSWNMFIEKSWCKQSISYPNVHNFSKLYLCSFINPKIISWRPVWQQMGSKIRFWARVTLLSCSFHFILPKVFLSSCYLPLILSQWNQMTTAAILAVVQSYLHMLWPLPLLKDLDTVVSVSSDEFSHQSIPCSVERIYNSLICWNITIYWWDGRSNFPPNVTVPPFRKYILEQSTIRLYKVNVCINRIFRSSPKFISHLYRQ